jgi:polysaccharide biosynthesis/export protein
MKSLHVPWVRAVLTRVSTRSAHPFSITNYTTAKDSTACAAKEKKLNMNDFAYVGEAKDQRLVIDLNPFNAICRCLNSVLKKITASCVSLGILSALCGCTLAPGSYSGMHAPRTGVDQALSDQGVSEVVKDGITFWLHALDSALLSRPPASADARALSNPMPAVRGTPAYRVESGDTLRVIVWDRPELNNPGFSSLGSSLVALGTGATTNSPIASAAGNLDPIGRVVQSDGTIYYPYVGKIKVAGETTDSIRRDLTARLDKVVRNPQLDVSVASYRSQRMYVSGAVKAPGAIALTDTPETVADAISGAGGYTDGADLEAVTLSRGGSQYKLDLYAFFYNGDVSQNVLLEDGDVLNLPDRRYKKVFVMGEVVKPISQVMPTGRFTLSEALSDAGGLNPLSANASQVYVFRKGPGTSVDVYQLDATSPGMLVLGDQFAMQPRDIVFVDAAAVSRFYRVVSQLVPFANAFYFGLQPLK